MREPIILELHVVQGWRAAGQVQLLLVAAFPLVLLAFVLAPNGPDAWAALVVGWPSCYAVARVLRPHVGICAERIARHCLAALSTSLGLLVILGIAFDTDSSSLGLWWVPTLGLLVTVPWGLVSACVRAAAVPIPTEPALRR